MNKIKLVKSFIEDLKESDNTDCEKYDWAIRVLGEVIKEQE